jgi:hypothetical protein
MSIKPCPKLSFRHDVIDTNHQIVVYTSDSKQFVYSIAKTFDAAFRNVELAIVVKIESMLEQIPPMELRKVLKPSEKLGTGLIPIPDDLWHRITLHDFTNGFIGLITQSELARLRGVSRQAVAQNLQHKSVEFFVFQKQKYIPFDTVAPTLETGKVDIVPNIFYYNQFGKNRQRIRRTFKKQPQELPIIRNLEDAT